MRISHKSAYQALFVQGRGSFRKELTVCLRNGRVSTYAQIQRMVMISDRPAEAEERAVPGHWESQCFCQVANWFALTGGYW